jgi:hypothetical protein
MGHAQHDPAEYVPKEMRAYWEARDPILLYEKFLATEKILDPREKKQIEDKIEALLQKERDFAENSPMPPAEFAAEGVYCTGDNCHKIQPKWERDKREVMPPKSSVQAVWTVAGFGAGKGSSGGMAPIHFGDTATPADEEKAEIEDKLAPKSPKKTIVKKKSAKAAAVAAGSRKARR